MDVLRKLTREDHSRLAAKTELRALCELDWGCLTGECGRGDTGVDGARRHGMFVALSGVRWSGGAVMM